MYRPAVLVDSVYDEAVSTKPHLRPQHLICCLTGGTPRSCIKFRIERRAGAGVYLGLIVGGAEQLPKATVYKVLIGHPCNTGEGCIGVEDAPPAGVAEIAQDNSLCSVFWRPQQPCISLQKIFSVTPTR